MLRRIIFPMALLALVISACSQNSPMIPTSTPASGIEGSVMEGPMCPGPVPIGNNPCPDQPYQATIIVLDSENNEITRIQTDVDGHFIIPLNPGVYLLHPLSGKPFPIARDQSIEVPAGQYVKVSIQYDTGMR